MSYRCRYCLQVFAWEEGSYQYIRSMILLHLGRCSTYGARRLSVDERSAEATQEADSLFVYPSQNDRPKQLSDEDRPQNHR